MVHNNSRKYKPMNYIKPLLGQRIIEACEDANIPAWGRNRAIGKALSVSPPAVSKWLTNKSLPTLDKLYELSNFLNVNAEWLVTGKGEKHKSLMHKTPEIRETIEIMETLSSAQQKAILEVARAFKVNPK